MATPRRPTMAIARRRCARANALHTAAASARSGPRLDAIKMKAAQSAMMPSHKTRSPLPLAWGSKAIPA
ncbi:MAG TPA: hypothetical protein EYP51_05915 [Thiotrichales bacterium]|nr:hypothetical protein [Thiotrichales bacterium]